ncbi:MAG TPA: hypothetical protein VGW75_13275 [Solirubrobacteraceae bacterium]|nr:hypothetical protein [Solirubrobacteraceae bacterium]
MTAARAGALAALAALAAAAPPAAAREAGVADLDARTAFVLDGIDDADLVAALGDVDGDGRADVAVWDEVGGEVRVVLGGERVPGLRGFRLAGVEDNGTRAVAAAGDVTGDGLADVAVDFSGRSGVAVVPGAREPRDVDVRRPEQRAITVVGPGVGYAAAAGDVNGDGTGDLVVAAIGDFEDDEPPHAWVVFGGEGLRGRVDVRRLGAGGFRIQGRPDDGLAVYSAAAAGDVDGDGLGDVVLGMPLAGLGRGEDEMAGRELLEASGAAYVVYGRRETTTVDVAAPGAATRIEGRPAGYLGLVVAGAGDVDGDGLGDVAVSAPIRPVRGPRAEQQRGDVFVVLGERERPASRDVNALGPAGFRVAGYAGGAATGSSLAAPGDVDGDGLADLLVGAPGTGEDDPVGGAAHVVYGAREPADVALAEPGDRALTLRGTSIEQAGTAVAGGTDLDADGHAEILVSRPGACRVARLYEGDVVAVELSAPPPPRGPGLGSPGPDALAGGPVGDMLLGFDGDDEVSGQDGHDCVSGGDGDDRLSGGRSGDAIFGELGADRVRGDAGCDRIYGGAGDDVIVAGPSRLPLAVRLQAPIGARDRDDVRAGTGNDVVRGGADSDQLSGGAGDDRMTGGPADDAIEGRTGRDRLSGGADGDFIVGGGGSDVIRGGPGRDFLGGDVDLQFEFGDFFYAVRNGVRAGDDDIAGGPGNDMMHGEGGRDRFDGGSGDDLAQGMRGDDLLLGRTGDDRLQAGPGDDRASGGSGRDELVGGSGDDVLSGGTFGDAIDAGYGRDRVSGGSGPDRIDVRDRDRDVVRCGPGRDRVTTDRRDVVRGCEVVNGSPRR